MSFDTLPAELQNVLLVNHSYITKWFVILSILLLSCFYIFVVWRNQEPSKFFTIVIGRVLLLGLSVGYLFSIPFLVLLLTPEYAFLDFFSLPLFFYKIMVSLLSIWLFVDLFRYGPMVMLRLGGLDLNDSNANEIANQIMNNRHSYKMGKRFKKHNRFKGGKK